MPHEITEKNEASLQQPEDEQIAVPVRIGDFLSELRNTFGDHLLVVSHALYGAAGQSRIGRC